jgi:4-amino-4-deoxychorismate mutase
MKKRTAPKKLPVDKHLLAADVLKKHRKRIDQLDAQILKLLGARFDVVRDVAKVKIKHDIPAFLGGRVNEVRNNAVHLGKKYGIDPDFMRTVYTMLIFQSCAEEEILKHAAQQKKAVKPKTKAATKAKTKKAKK